MNLLIQYLIVLDAVLEMAHNQPGVIEEALYLLLVPIIRVILGMESFIPIDEGV